VRNQHRALCQHNSKKNSRKYVKISKINKYIGVRYNLEIGIPDFLSDNRLDLDQRELPTYIAAATDVNPDINVLAWWEIHEQEIPNWAKACMQENLAYSTLICSLGEGLLIARKFLSRQPSMCYGGLY